MTQTLTQKGIAISRLMWPRDSVTARLTEVAFMAEILVVYAVLNLVAQFIASLQLAL